jgi:hypothetical protein
MNPYLVLAAYRLSIKAAESIVLVRDGHSIEMQMRNGNGDLFHRIDISQAP